MTADDDRGSSDDAPNDARATRRDQRREAERARMQKHGARTADTYRNAILKRLRKLAGKQHR